MVSATRPVDFIVGLFRAAAKDAERKQLKQFRIQISGDAANRSFLVGYSDVINNLNELKKNKTESAGSGVSTESIVKLLTALKDTEDHTSLVSAGTAESAAGLRSVADKIERANKRVADTAVSQSNPVAANSPSRSRVAGIPGLFKGGRKSRKLGNKFNRCVKSVRQTVRARPKSTKESAAIAICTKSVLQTRGLTMKRYKKKRLVTQKKFRGGGIVPTCS